MSRETTARSNPSEDEEESDAELLEELRGLWTLGNLAEVVLGPVDGPVNSDDPKFGLGKSDSLPHSGGVVHTEPLKDAHYTGIIDRAEVVPREQLDSEWDSRYIPDEMIGRGGFGVVYRGRDLRLGRAVAIKMTRPDRSSPVDLNRLYNEAIRAVQLEHPGIVRVYDARKTTQQCVIVTELLDGVTLDEWARSRKANWVAIANLVAQVADALGYAHSLGVIHRDVKPSNILVIGGVRPVLLDLGLAIADHESDRGQGDILGTPHYMSPEQARRDGHHPDGRIDIYSLGVVLYELMTGRLPHRAKELPHLLRSIIENDPQPPRQILQAIPPELERICLKAIARKMDNRYGAATDLAEDLRRFVLEADISARLNEATLTRLPNPTSASLTPSPRSGAADAQPADSSSPNSVLSESSQRRTLARRQLTVLRCESRLLLDRAGSDQDDFDFEEQEKRFLRLVEIYHAAVKELGGWVVPTEGRSLLAYFGYPKGLEEAPRLAIQAGLKVLRQYREADQSTCQPSLAVNSAVSVIGSAPPDQPPTIMGDVILESERLARLANPGELIINAPTYRLVQGFFEFRESDGQPGSYKVCATLQARNRIEAAAESLTPLIGRSLEVELLKDRWESAVDGTRHIVMVRADPGVGKSRLVSVLKQHVLNVTPSSPAHCIEWFGSEHQTNSPLGPVIDFFSRKFGLQEVSEPTARIDRLLTGLKSRGIVAPGSQALFASLLSISAQGRLPELNLSPEVFKHQVFETILQWLANNSSEGLLFVVEDLHWFDPTTLDLLRRFVDESAVDSSRILGVFTSRLDFEPPWRGRDNLTTITLPRLKPNQVDQLMTALTGVQVPRELVSRTFERTEGVPLFVEVFTRSLIDSTPNFLQTGRFGGESFAIPATLHDMLFAQLDRVASNMEVVQIGALIGRRFGFDMIAHTVELDRPALERELEKLVSVGILSSQGHGDEATYTFRHALIQDAAIEFLPGMTRRRFHHRIADTLETRFPGVRRLQPERLARHLTESGDYSSAVQVWSEAGRRAANQGAHAEALEHLGTALDLIRRQPEGTERWNSELPILIELAVSFSATKGYGTEEVGKVLADARAICDIQGNSASLFNVLRGICSYYITLCDIDNAEQSAKLCLEIAEHTSLPEHQIEADYPFGYVCYMRGNLLAARFHLERAIQVYRENNGAHLSYPSPHDPSVGALSCLLLVLLVMGDSDGFERVSRELAEARASGSAFDRVFALCFELQCLTLLGDHDAASRKADEAIEICHVNKYHLWRAIAESYKGIAIGHLGHADEGLAMAEAAHAFIVTAGCRAGRALVLGNMALLIETKGDAPATLEAIDRAIAFSREWGEVFSLPYLLTQRARVMRLDACDNLESIEALLREAVELARHSSAMTFAKTAEDLLAELP